jgi:hypothetical protein
MTPEVPAPRVPHGPAQHGVVRVAGVVVAGVDLHPVPVRVPQVHVEGVGHAVPPRAALDPRLLGQRAEDVADPQHLVRLVGEEPQVVQARPGAAGERHVVHGLLAVHPGRVERVAVLDGLGQAEAERPVILVGGADVRHHDVEVVQPRHLGAAAQVVTLLQALRVVGGEEELHGEAERVLGPDRLPDAGRGTRGHPGGPRAERRVEGLRQVQVGGGADPEREPARGGFRAFTQDQVVMGELVEAAQVEHAGVGAGDHEAEQVDPEPAGSVEIGDDELGVGGAHDVGGYQGHDHAPNRGTPVSPSGMWTIRDSV